MRAHNPLTRETLPRIVLGQQVARPAADESPAAEPDAPDMALGADSAEDSSSSHEVEESKGAHEAGAAGDTAARDDVASGDEEALDDETASDRLHGLWDLGVEESVRYAGKLRAVAQFWPHAEGLHQRDEVEYALAQSLRTTITHASRLLTDARRATNDLPSLLGLLDEGALPARWFTLVLRRSGSLNAAQLTDLDASIASWDLRVPEDRFSRSLGALVQWLRDRDRTTPTPVERSVSVFTPDEDGTACVQIHGPAPEILALGRRLDSAAKAVQQAQRHALAQGAEIPFDDGTVTTRGAAMTRARLRYEILTRSILDTGGVDVPKERFRINVTVPAFTLMGITNAPGMLDGIHPIPADMARDLAGSTADWYRILNDPTTGAFLPLPATKYVATKEMLEYVRLPYPVCAVPGCTRPSSWAAEHDHIQEYYHPAPELGGRTEIENLHWLCWVHHQMKTAGILDPIKDSITHPVTHTPRNTTPAVTASGTRDGPPPSPTGQPPTGPPPDESTPKETSPPQDHATQTPTPSPAATGAVPENAPCPDPSDPWRTTNPDAPWHNPDPENPGKARITGFEPGQTSWTLHDGAPLHVADECDLITPWITAEFLARWNALQERITAHHAEQARLDALARGETPPEEPDPEPPPF